MRVMEMGQEAIEKELEVINQQCCDPPLAEEEVDQIAKIMGGYEPGMEGATKGAGEIPFYSAAELLSRPPDALPEVIGQGVLPEGGSLILSGVSAIGKSLMTLEMAFRLSQGEDLWGLTVSKPRKVLVIQAENPEAQVCSRLRQIDKGLGLEPDSLSRIYLVYSGLDLGSDVDVRRLQSLVERSEAEVAVIDPLSSYHHKDENNNSEMRGILDKLTHISRQTGVSWIIVHHHGKPWESKTQYRGASSIKDWCDTLINLKGSLTSPIRKVEFEKVRHGPQLPVITLERDGWLCHRLAEVGKAPPSKVVQVLNVLGGNCKGKAPLVEKLREITGCGKSAAYKAVEKAINEGVIIQEGEGRKTSYSLL